MNALHRATREREAAHLSSLAYGPTEEPAVSLASYEVHQDQDTSDRLCGMSEEQIARSRFSHSVEQRTALTSSLKAAVGVLAAAAITFALFTLIERWQR